MLKKTAVRIILSCVIVSMLLYSVSGVEKKKSSPSSGEKTLSGKIVKVDLSVKTIQIKDEIGEYLVYIDEQTRIQGKNGDEIKTIPVSPGFN